MVPAAGGSPALLLPGDRPRAGGWIQTFTGRRFWPFDPEPDDVDIHDIAHALSNLCRFAGHCREFYSVAQHSVLVASQLEGKDALWGLLHDAAEAYVVDMPQPIKRHYQMSFYRATEQRIEWAIRRRFGLEGPAPRSVKVADLRALFTEKRDLLSESGHTWEAEASFEPFPFRIGRTWEPSYARDRFLGWFALTAGKAVSS